MCDKAAKLHRLAIALGLLDIEARDIVRERFRDRMFRVQYLAVVRKDRRLEPRLEAIPSHTGADAC